MERTAAELGGCEGRDEQKLVLLISFPIAVEGGGRGVSAKGSDLVFGVFWVLLHQFFCKSDAEAVDIFLERHASSLIQRIDEVGAVGAQHLCHLIELQIMTQIQLLLLHQ